jgi:hypothetical protein
MTEKRILDRFTNGPLPYWTRLATGSAEVQWEPDCLRFLLRDAVEMQLANAEIGDYRSVARSRLPWQPPLRLWVRARFSHLAADLGGTSGFGFWNNPFDMDGGDVLAPPNVLWFFCASPQSDMIVAPGHPGHGFRAEMINGGSMPGWLVAMGNWLLRLPGLTNLLYQMAQRQVHAGAVRIDGLELAEWHDYVIFWERREAVFSVDDREVLRVPRPPDMPLGFVAWMDNQVAVARPDGEFRFGLEALPGEQWLELERIEIEVL